MWTYIFNVVVVLVIVIAATYPSQPDPKWNSTQENGTEDLSLSAIGLAPNRGKINES